MDAAFFKTVGLAVLAILFIIGAAHFLKEEFDLRRNRGAQKWLGLFEQIYPDG